MRTLAIAAAAVLSSLVFLPQTASAGEVWTDGNYYAACPETIVIQSDDVEMSPLNGWTDGFEVASGYACSFTRAYVDAARRDMYCEYSEACGQFRTRMAYPEGYSTCTAYGGIWFICQ